VSDHADPGSARRSPALGIAGQVAANASLLVASLVYMGWAYDTALYGYFHLNPLYLDIGVVEYMLVSLSLFSPVLIILVTVLIVGSAARTWRLDRARVARVRRARRPASRIVLADSHGRAIPEDGAAKPGAGRVLLISLGVILTAAAVVLVPTAGYLHLSSYLVLGLLGVGAIMLTWPNRADRLGRFPYAVAIVLAAICALWGGSLYATQLGKHAAEHVVRDLPARTAVTLYTTESLALSGPGVYVRALPPGSLYHFRYQGLRLLTMRSGNYYLLPVGWSTHRNPVYVISDTDQTRIELS
jgi:hypothetical protein